MDFYKNIVILHEQSIYYQKATSAMMLRFLAKEQLMFTTSFKANIVGLQEVLKLKINL